MVFQRVPCCKTPVYIRGENRPPRTEGIRISNHADRPMIYGYGVVAHPIVNARTMIDFQILYTRTDWSDPAIMERLKRAEKCEVLVPQKIPLDHIGNMPNG